MRPNDPSDPPSGPTAAVAVGIDDAMSQIRTIASAHGDAGLAEIAAVLERLARSPHWNGPAWRKASPGDECLHEVAVTPGLASLYLVSDGAGVVSPPHGHGTWAVIAGIHGNEANMMYRESGDGRVAAIDRRVVGPGDSLILTASAIHSTEVVGAASTFHLHLYGRPLSELAPFESRVVPMSRRTSARA